MDSDKIPPRRGRGLASAWSPRTLGRLCLGGGAWSLKDTPSEPGVSEGRLVPQGHSSVLRVSVGTPGPRGDTPAPRFSERCTTEFLNHRGQDGVRTTEHPRRHQPCAALLRLHGPFLRLGASFFTPPARVPRSPDRERRERSRARPPLLPPRRHAPSSWRGRGSCPEAGRARGGGVPSSEDRGCGVALGWRRGPRSFGCGAPARTCRWLGLKSAAPAPAHEPRPHPRRGREPGGRGVQWAVRSGHPDLPRGRLWERPRPPFALRLVEQRKVLSGVGVGGTVAPRIGPLSGCPGIERPCTTRERTSMGAVGVRAEVGTNERPDPQKQPSYLGPRCG